MSVTVDYSNTTFISNYTGKLRLIFINLYEHYDINPPKDKRDAYSDSVHPP